MCRCGSNNDFSEANRLTLRQAREMAQATAADAVQRRKDLAESESPCEPRPRVVPEVGSPPVEPENRHPAPVVTPQRLVVGPLGHMWLRGIGYDALRSELADGYYPDDTLT